MSGMEGPKNTCVTSENAVHRRSAGMRMAFQDGLRVAGEHRNATMVAALIACMTFAAAVLMLLEPSTPRLNTEPLLLAAAGQPISSVVVHYAGPGDRIERDEFDLLVEADGSVYYRQESIPSELRVWVNGTNTDGSVLSEAQATSLMRALSSLIQTTAVTPRRVCLHPDSNPWLRPELPLAAHELTDMLARKGVVVNRPRQSP